MALLAFLVLSQFGEACQGLLVRMTPADLWSQADIVLIGVVEDISVHQGDRGMIYRNVRIEVEKYRKNALNSSEVVIRVLGGQVGEFGVWVEDQPCFSKGERVLAYLDHISGEDQCPGIECYYVVGGPQGKFTILDGVAKNEAGDTLYVGDPFWFLKMSNEMKIMSGSVLFVVASLILFRRKTSR